jgi:sugar phosphate isomerase/epimerase
MMMNLTINGVSLVERFGWEKTAEICKKAGFDSMDYSLGCMEKPEDIFNDKKEYIKAAEALRRVIDLNGLPVTQTHAPFVYYGWKDPKVYEEFIMPSIRRSIEVSAILGAKVTVVHPLHHFVYKGNEEEIYEKNMEFYRSLIPICKAYGIKVGIENMFQRELLRAHISFDTCATIAEFIRYVDTLDSEYMVACLDIGHVGLPVTDERAWDFIRALGHDRLQALHVHDNDYRNDRHALPYQGKIDWDEVTRALGEIDYKGDFTYELDGKVIVPEGMDDAFIPTQVKYIADVGKLLCSKIEKQRIVK